MACRSKLAPDGFSCTQEKKRSQTVNPTEWIKGVSLDPVELEEEHMSASEKIRLTILEELQPVQARVSSLRSSLDKEELEEARLKASLEGLELEEIPQEAKPEENSNVSPTKKQSANQQDVRKVVMRLVKKMPDIRKDTLEKMTKDELKDGLGLSLSGFTRCWRAVMGSQTFLVADDNTITVATSKAEEVVSATVNIGSSDPKLPVEISRKRL